MKVIYLERFSLLVNKTLPALFVHVSLHNVLRKFRNILFISGALSINSKLRPRSPLYAVQKLSILGSSWELRSNVFAHGNITVRRSDLDAAAVTAPQVMLDELAWRQCREFCMKKEDKNIVSKCA
jgi:hypothetical protein